MKTMIEIMKEILAANPQINKFSLMDQARKIFKKQKNASSK